MSTSTQQSKNTFTTTPRGVQARRTATAAAYVIASSSVAFAAIGTFTKTDDGGSFRRTADYWYTGIGVPTAVGAIVLMVAAYRMLGTRRGALARAGVVLNALALGTLAVQLAGSVIMGSELRWGPTYILATAATFVGHALFVAGAWRTGLLPRPMLAIWPVVWVIGSFAAQGPTPLLLTAFLIVAVRMLPDKQLV
jgi:hypothetical protein